MSDAGRLAAYIRDLADFEMVEDLPVLDRAKDHAT